MAWTILYTIEDSKSEKATTEIKLPQATTYADVVLFAGQMALLINAITTGAIRRIGIAFSVTLPGGLRASPLSGADVEEGGKFQFITSGGFDTSLRLATFDEDNILDTSRDIVTDDVAVAAFITAMLSGINLTGVGGSGTIQPSDARNEDIVSLSFAKEQFLNSRG